MTMVYGNGTHIVALIFARDHFWFVPFLTVIYMKGYPGRSFPKGAGYLPELLAASCVFRKL
jgi:hypothetical protein